MKSHSGLFFIFLAFFFIYSCSPFKTMQEDEVLLYKQKIRGNKELSRSDLKTSYQLTPNRRFFKIYPGITFYNIGYSFFDSAKVANKKAQTIERFDKRINQNSNNSKKKENLNDRKEKRIEKLEKKLQNGNRLMRMGEAPVVFDTAKINLTEKLIKHQVFANGFFESKIMTQIDTSKRRVSVTYKISEGPSSSLVDIVYKIHDKNIESLINSAKEESELKKYERYCEQNVTKELARMVQILKNNGYYNFGAEYIHFNVDTTKKKNEVIVQTVINNPPGKSAHPIYKINSVIFTADENKIDSNKTYDTLEYENVQYRFNNNIYFSKKILDRKIKIQKGDIYRQEAAQQTQRNLLLLDIFRTATIQNTPDTVNHTLVSKINTFTLSPFQLNGETGLNINQSTVPGPFGSLNYKHRNALKKLGIFELNLKAAIAAQASVLNPQDVLRTEEYLGQVSLALPQLYMPFFRNTKWENYDPQTKTSLGFNIIDRTEYKRTSAQTSIGYSINPDKNTSILFTPLEVNIINTARISDPFKDYLLYLKSRGNNLIEGFKNSYVSDINFSYLFNNYDYNVNTKGRYQKYYFESGGTFQNLRRSETMFGLETFRYLRFMNEYRFYNPVRKNTIAYRVNVGAVYPYGQNNALPYEKYFFAGGPNSLRAWKLRRLGPGSYAPIDSTTGKINNRVESPGEFLLEANIEYRFKIVGFFEGATFIDAGNVWMLTKDDARPGAQLKPGTFIKNIAVGTGLGLRLNFSFLLIRFDFGIKAYDPAVQKFILFGDAIKQTQINIGIGYPF